MYSVAFERIREESDLALGGTVGLFHLVSQRLDLEQEIK